MTPLIQVESDYDGYFEALVRKWYSQLEKEGKVPKAKIVTVSAGPYRSQAVECRLSQGGNLHIDFYSALRTGFGRLSLSEVAQIKEQFL